MKPIQLYSLNTPNGQKVGIALEEMGLLYEPHTVNIFEGDQFKEEFVRISPNAKIPVILDPNGPEGDHIVFESGAILLYLAEKSGRFLSKYPILRSQTLQWLFFQMSGVGPMFGQFGHFFKYAVDKCDHPYPLKRYTNEVRRLLLVIEKRLEGRNYFVGEEYSIADMAIFPWILCLEEHYKAAEYLGLKEFINLSRWKDNLLSREKTRIGLEVCSL